MLYIKIHDKFKDRIVGRIDNNVLEYDEEMMGRILEEIWDIKPYKRCDGKIKEGKKIDVLKDKLYNPYFVSEDESPEFEIYKFKKELRNGNS